MGNSILFAGILGPVLVAIGLGVIIDPIRIKKAEKEIYSSSALSIILGVGLLILGILIVKSNYQLALSWYGLVAFIGFLLLAKGALMILFPKVLQKASEVIFKKTLTRRLIGVLMLLAGGYLSWIVFL